MSAREQTTTIGPNQSVTAQEIAALTIWPALATRLTFGWCRTPATTAGRMPRKS